MMLWLRRSALSLLALLAVTLLISTAQADTAPASPIKVALDQRVIDLTNTLDATAIRRLTDQLAALEQRKGAQIAVLLVPSTGRDSQNRYKKRAHTKS